MSDGPELFVDRVDLMEELRALAADTVAGRGRVLIVDGVSGMGKTTLVREFLRREQECRVILVTCSSLIGPGIPGGVFRRIAEKLLPPQREPSAFGKVRGLLTRAADQAAPDVMSMFIPAGGAMYSAGKAIVQASIGPGVTPADSLRPFALGQARYLAEGLVKAARDGKPVVLIVDDIQECDLTSLEVLDELMRHIVGERFGVVVTHAVDGGSTATASAAVASVLRMWADGRPHVRRRDLAGLPAEAVDELVRHSRADAPADLSRALYQHTQGDPAFVTMFLEAWEPVHGAEFRLPEGGTRALAAERLARFEGQGREQDLEILAAAAIQGQVFLSAHVAQAAGVSHDVVLARLAAISRQGNLIEPAPEAEFPAWMDGDDAEASDVYRFEHRALWQLVATKQTDTQRKRRHAQIAQALTWGPVRDLPLARRVEIARHLRAGGRECLVEAAQAHYDLAYDAAVGRRVGEKVVGGLSFAEAEDHASTAIDTARSLTNRQEPQDLRDARLIKAIELLLSLTEVRWRGMHQPAGGADVDRLAEEAEQAAERLADPGLLIRTTLQRGKTLLATQGVAPSLAKLGKAVDMAEAHGDVVVEYIARVEHGRQLPKQNLAAGLAELRRAERLYETITREAGPGDPILEHARNLGEMQLGINLYDSGELGESLERVRSCVDRLRGERFSAELPIALNYLAQIYLGLGLHDDAERALREALLLEEDRGGDSGWHACNQALLARLLMERGSGDGEDALALAAEAWGETQRTWLVNLVPIVRNLYAETLLLGSDRMTPASARLEQAERLAAQTCEETGRSGMVRSRIAGFSLRSRVQTRLGNVGAAVEHARTAVRILDEVGDMPALRSEEVYFHAAVVLNAAGFADDAADLLQRARIEVRRKAATLPDAALRERFRTGVPLNAAIAGGLEPAPGVGH
ncbi:AAA family ATPase [Myceligenerans crystallogenes]|uniref:AAA family ATPase n=1 Tax=Myceligenerans crystallogenes TaxID=316335 RepID=UPI0031E191AF